MNIKEIMLLTNNLSETREFYSAVIGFRLLKETDRSLSFYAGKSILTFNESVEISKPTYHFAFNIPENQLRDAIDWSRNRIQLLTITENSNIADYRQWNAHAFYFLDNNGNVLELIARHDLNNSSVREFSVEAIECISEIGLVSARVPEFTDSLMDNFHLPLFTKQVRQANFAALGDDHGLLIIVGNDRCWFPTEVLSKNFPLSVLINRGKADQLLLFD